MVQNPQSARGDVSDPFIVTAALPDDIFAWADRLRQAHFPAERNHLKAHVTLFHAFAPTLFDELKTVLPQIAADTAPPEAELGGLMNLGRGTAIDIRSPRMLEVRERIAERFHGALTKQDQHKPRLHITVQNKVEPNAAKALQRELDGSYERHRFRFTGLELHVYRGGPWEFVKRWSFRG